MKVYFHFGSERGMKALAYIPSGRILRQFKKCDVVTYQP